jgi:predicted RNase H-like HicB family nuclease
MKPYTVLIRKNRLEYVAVCLELNLTARGDDIADVENNLRSAIDLYLEDIRDNPDTVVSPISVEELIEFLKDTESEWSKEHCKGMTLHPLAIHEVRAYA